MKFSENFDKNYLAKVAMYVLSAILALGLIFYISYHVMKRFSPGLDLVDAVPYTLVKTVGADAYIMRNEKALYTQGIEAGSVTPAVADGEKVSAFSKVADIYSNTSPDIERRISEIDDQIALLQKNQSEGRSVTSTEGLDAEIYDEVFEIRSRCENGNYSEALSLRSSLLLDIKKKQILTGGISDYPAQISLLQSEKNSLKKQLGTCLSTIYSDCAGYYFSEYDGYGNVFSADKIDSMSYDDFTEMTDAEAENVTSLCVGTMVESFRWYIACDIPKSDAAGLANMSSCNVEFVYSGENLNMKLYRLIPQTPGDRAVVVLSCERMPENFDYTRVQPVKISVAEYTGFKIPIEAVRVIGGFEGVFILDEVTAEFRRINIIYEENGIVICNGNPDPEKTTAINDEIYPWISRNDIVIVSGTELYNGKIMN